MSTQAFCHFSSCASDSYSQSQQDFKVIDSYLQSMTTENKPLATLNIVLMSDTDIQKAYKLGIQVAKDSGVIFLGMNIFTLPNRQAEHLSFLTDVDKLNSIIEKVKEGLGIEPDNLRYEIRPFSLPKEKPPPQSMAT